jgi:phenylacetate-CoA ligase
VKNSQLIAMCTSGSTGEKLEFYSDRKNYHSWACTIRGDMWAGYGFGDRQVHLWRVHNAMPWKIKLRNGFRNLLIDHTTILNEQQISDIKLEEHLLRFNKIRPHFFIGSPGILAIFASFIQKNGLNVHTPNGIISAADMLFEHDRKLIEEVFRCKVLNRYGSTEVFHIAGECSEQNGMHISSEHIYLEIIDDQGNPCKIGMPGEVVITDMTNYSFPFIRYKIGDLAVLSEKKCPCGRGLPLLEKLEGRVANITIGPNGTKVVDSFWNELLHEKIVGIEKFQIRQDKINHIFIKLVTNSDFIDSSINKIDDLTKIQFSKLMNVDVVKVDDIPLPKNGKRQYVISDLSLET